VLELLITPYFWNTFKFTFPRLGKANGTIAKSHPSVVPGIDATHAQILTRPPFSSKPDTHSSIYWSMKVKSKIETQALTLVQAKVVFDAELNVDEILKTKVSNAETLKPSDILSDPREWAKLANVLVLRDKPEGFQVDFEKLAAYYNAAFIRASSGNPKPPKLLTAGECRKIVIALTRDQLRCATADLKRNQADDTAKLAKEQALAILEKYGWSQQKTTRRKKASKLSESSAKVAPEPAIDHPAKSEATHPVSQAGLKPGDPKPAITQPVSASPKQAPSPLNGAKTDESDAGQSSIRFYVKGNSDELSEKFLNIGGKRDDAKGEWYFPTPAHQTIARNLRSEVSEKKAQALKAVK
jgi:hypothetical protein